MKLIYFCLIILVLTLIPLGTYAQTCIHLYQGKVEKKSENVFYSFDGAQGAVRKLVKAGLSNDVVVFVHEGIYPIFKSLQFDQRDRGSDNYTVTWCAWPGDQVVISGGVPVVGWARKSDKLWVADIPVQKSGNPKIRNLYCDGKRLQRSRFPNEGEMLKIAEVGDNYKNIIFNQNIIQTTAPDAEIVVYQNWNTSRGILDKIEIGSVHSTTPLGWIGHESCIVKKGMSAYLENALEFIDIPGEWYADHQSGKIYYQASENEDPNQSKFVIPVTNKLLEINGSAMKKVNNLHFSNLTFSHSNWEFPSFGYNEIQAAHYGSELKKNVPTFSLPAAIDFKYASGCKLTGCTIEHIGSSGIAIGAGCKNNIIERCHINDISANGIVIGQRDWPLLGQPAGLDDDWKDKSDIPLGNQVINCHIHNCGEEMFGSVGIYDAFTQESRITSNEIHNLPYTGISIGFKWGEEPTSHAKTIVEFNRVYDVMKKVADGGCIYTLGYQPGTIIRNNLLYDAHRSTNTFGGAPNNGIFFDQGSKGLLIENNIIFNCSGGAIRFNQTNEGNLLWKKNFYDILPEKEGFPNYLYRKTGND